MAKYLKLFNNHIQYEAFTATTGFILPNVSHCIQEAEVHYNPYVEPVGTKLMANYNVTSTSNPTLIGYNQYISGFSAIKIDGVAQPSVVSSYTFNTLGEHTVEYTLTNPTTIDTNAFYGCANLINVVMPDNITTINYAAFCDCSGLTSITMSSAITSIGDDAFGNCGFASVGVVGSGANLEIPNGVTSIGRSVFMACENLTSVTIPSGVTYIGESAFENCTALTTFTFAQNSQLTFIDGNAFNSCGIINISIPNNVTEIGWYAFYDCASLTNVTIPSSVTEIGDYAFNFCSSLATITCNASTAPTIYENTFCEIGTNGTLYVPYGSSDYDTWMQYNDYYLGIYDWTMVEQ